MQQTFNVTVEYQLGSETVTETLEVKAFDEIDAEDAAFSKLKKRIPNCAGIDFLDVAEAS